MSRRGHVNESGHSERDWEIFDVLCGGGGRPSPATRKPRHQQPDNHEDDGNGEAGNEDEQPEPPCGIDHSGDDHLNHSLDLATTLRSELAASGYKRDRLMNELVEAKSSLCGKESECEALRAQTARQSTLIGSLQSRLQAAESRERNLQARNESTTQSLQREKRTVDDKIKELHSKLRRAECDLASEEGQRVQIKEKLLDFVRRLCVCLGIDMCDTNHSTPDLVLTRSTEIMAELHRLRTKVTGAHESLATCESELHAMRNATSADKQRTQTQLDAANVLSQELDGRCRQTERELQATKDRLTEAEMAADKLKEELRGFESRCARLQSSADRFQGDRLQYLRNVAAIVGVTEPCETLIKDKIRELANSNQTMHNQLVSLRDQISMEGSRHRETQESVACRLRAEEIQRATIEERCEKTQADLVAMRLEHTTLSEFLVRLARALCWSECIEPPAHGADTAILMESLLERAERLAIHHEYHVHGICDKQCWDCSHHTFQLPKLLRRERSCHDIPLKESSTMYAMQRRVRVLREQVQRRDMHLELLRRKIALLEDGARGKTVLLSERDDAMGRARRSAKQADRTAQQLADAKAHLSEARAQLAEATDYKITALERGRKIDELETRLVTVDTDKSRLATQLAQYKLRARSTVELSNDRKCRDETTINTLRDDLARIKLSLADANHRLSQLQTFRSSVARLLHLRDLPEADLLQRLQTLTNAHQEFTLLSRRYESASPVGEHPCPRFDDLIPPSSQCRPVSSSPGHLRSRYDDSGFNDDHYDDEYEFAKKY